MSRYLDISKVTAVAITELPAQRLDPDGYTKAGGSPTDMVIKVDSKSRRVMFMCFGTGSTAFVKLDGDKAIITSSDYWALRSRA